MNSKEAHILTILRQHPTGLFGLEIIERSHGTLGRGSVYVHLGNLDEKGLVTTESVPQPIGLARTRYKLSRKGIRALDELLLDLTQLLRVSR